VELLEDRLTPTLTNHGGAILANVQVQALYLGSDWNSNSVLNSQTAVFDQFLSKTVSGSYMTMLRNAGFTGPGGSIVGTGTSSAGAIDGVSIPITDLNNYANTVLLDSQIHTYLQSAISNHLVQQPNANTLYDVFVQDNVIVDFGTTLPLGLNDGNNSVNDFLGYHSSFMGTDANNQPANIRYSAIPYQGSNGFLNNSSGVANAQEPWLSVVDSATAVTSHELAEAVTDPDGSTWYDTRTGNEVGDIVLASTVYLNGFAVQREAAIQASTTNFRAMTPAGATAGHEDCFVLDPGGTLFEINPQGVRTQITTATPVASISNQGIDQWGQPMIDLVFTDGTATEYHDFLPGNQFVTNNPSVLPFTSLGSAVKQAVAGQGVSYVLFTNGTLKEFVDPNDGSQGSGYGFNPTPHSGGVIATNVISIDAGTDKIGGNSVDYTVTVSGKTALFEYHDVTNKASQLTATGSASVTAFSAGQQGIHGYVANGAGFVYSETASSAGPLPASPLSGLAVTSVVVGVDATGNYQLEVLYGIKVAFLYDSATAKWTQLGTHVQTLAKTFDGVVAIMLTNGYTFDYLGANSTLWLDNGAIAVA
jgi:hypothetical protein